MSSNFSRDYIFVLLLVSYLTNTYLWYVMCRWAYKAILELDQTPIVQKVEPLMPKILRLHAISYPNVVFLSELLFKEYNVSVPFGLLMLGIIYFMPFDYHKYVITNH